MILSQSHNFIFVHVPKTAGTAMTAALEPYAVTGTRTLLRRALRRLPVREAPERAYFRKHETARDMERKMGVEVFRRYFRFTVVRDPFDHAVSHYEYLKEFRNPRLAERFRAMGFADYLEHRMTARGLFVPFFTVLPDQAHFLVGDDGALLVDRVLRFERLAADLAELAETLGLAGLRLERVNPTRAKVAGRELASYYDDRSLALVRRLYARDFDLLGYSRNLPSAAASS